MSKTTKNGPHINVFALPNQTTVLFVLIVAVLLVTVTVGGLTASPLTSWPLALGLMILPLRAILKRPEHNLHCNDLATAGEDLADLNRVITSQVKAMDLSRKPVLVVSPRDVPLYTFGSFRHWYIAVGKEAAEDMQKQLKDPEVAPTILAQLTHELYHFKTGDYWQLGYTGELLRVNFLLMAWAVTFFLGMGLFLIIATRDFLEFDATAMFSRMNFSPELARMLSKMLPSPDQMTEMRDRASQVNLGLVITYIFSAIWPFVAVGLVIWRIYWPRLWRMRELYADAGMAHQQSQITPALSVLTHLPLPILNKHLDDLTPPERHKRRVFAKRNIVQIVGEGFERLRAGKNLRHIGKKLGCSLGLLPGEFHPNSATRIAALLNPGLIFDDWKAVAVLVGSLMLLLEILLLSPFTFLIVGRWPMHFPTLATVILVALNYLIHTIARGRPTRTDLLKIIGVVGGLRFLLIFAIIVMLVIMLVTVPDTLHEILCVAIANLSGYAGNSVEICYEDLEAFVVEATVKNLSQAFVMPALIIIALIIIDSLVRRIFTWYSLPNGKQCLLRVIYGCIIVVSLFWGLTVLPFVTDLILRPLEILLPAKLAFEASGLLIAMVGGILFVRADRKYARRCPKCGEIIPGDFSPGKQCCGEVLHPWLVTEYDL